MRSNCSGVAAMSSRFSAGSASIRGASSVEFGFTSPTSRSSVSAISDAFAAFSGTMRYSIVARAGDSSSCESSFSMTGKLSTVPVTTRAFERRSATTRALTCTAGVDGSTFTATPCVRPVASSCSDCVSTRTASSAFAFFNANVRIRVSSALDGASSRSTSARTCSNCPLGALTSNALVRTSGVMATPCPEFCAPPRPRNCSATMRAMSTARPFLSTMMSLCRSPPDCG